MESWRTVTVTVSHTTRECIYARVTLAVRKSRRRRHVVCRVNENDAREFDVMTTAGDLLKLSGIEADCTSGAYSAAHYVGSEGYDVELLGLNGTLDDSSYGFVLATLYGIASVLRPELSIELGAVARDWKVSDIRVRG